jgi:hypothetical protein
MKAACQRCGSDKPGPLVPCRSCHHVPVGEERTLAWLLSDHHLSPSSLETAAARIRAGERLAPPEELLAKARQGLQQAIPGRRRRPKEAPDAAEQGSDDAPSGSAEASTVSPGAPSRAERPTWISAPSLRALLELDAVGPPGGSLPPWAIAAFTAASLLLTPVPMWVAWWLWRGVAPRAARQMWLVAMGSSLGLALLWLSVMAWAWGQRVA